MMRLAALLALLLCGCPESGRSDGPGDDSGPAFDLLADGGGEDLQGDQGAQPGSDSATRDAGADGLAGDLTGEMLSEVEPLVPPELGGEFDKVLAEFLAFSGEPGATARVRLPNGSVWRGEGGVSDLKTQTKMDHDSTFRVGSGTKPYLAVLILQLVEEGKLTLDDTLGELLPQYGSWAQITVRQLLGMQSGLPDYLVDVELWLDGFSNPGQPYSPEQLLEYVLDDQLLFPPGEGCAYSNTGYVLAGLIVEELTGNAVETELQNRILGPLGLESTFLDSAGTAVEGLAHGYADIDVMGAVFGIPEAFTAFVPEEVFVDDTLIDCTYLFHPTVAWAAGAMVSNARDMVRFARAVMGGELLSADSLAEMTAMHPCQLFGGTIQYGLGLFKYQTEAGAAYGHGGLNFGYESNTLVVPATGLSVTHMHNYLPEQSWALGDDLVSVAVAPVATNLPLPCVAPEGFLDPPAGKTSLQFRFKGRVAENKPGKEIQGIGAFFGHVGDEKLTLYGLFTGAKLTAAGLQQRVEIDSLGPGDGAKVLARYVMLSMASNDIKSSGEDRTLDLAGAAPYTLFGAVAEIEGAAPGPQKLCIVAVPKDKGASKVFICGSSADSIAIGETVKLYGNVEMQTDTAAIESYLSVVQFPRCTCRTGDGAWGPCEETGQ
jgi:D-alanyl-D-alanine carboxypeptidase